MAARGHVDEDRARRVRAVAALLALVVVLGGAGPVAAHDTAQARDAARDSVAGPGAALSAAVGLRDTQFPSLEGRDRGRTARWGWPLAGTPRIVNGFDPPEQRWLAGHRGIDLAGVAGEPVLAVEAGVVSYSGQIAGVGIVSVTHADGLLSTYQPVADRVERGAGVSRGDVLGTLDLGGHCLVVDCLHLGARRGRDVYLDPTPLLVPLELTLVPPQGSR